MAEEKQHPEGLTEAQEQLALELFGIGAIKFGAFRLKLHEKRPDAPLSPIYVDLRILRSCPFTMKAVVKVFERMSEGFEFDCYADVPTAATPIVAVLSCETWVPMITPREPKTHGAIGSIDGVFEPGQTVLLIDDLVIRADSKLEAIKTLEGNKLIVRDVLVLVDREQGGPEQLREAGYTLHAAFKLSQLLRYYVRVGKIDQNKYDEVMTYLETNR